MQHNSTTRAHHLHVFRFMLLCNILLLLLPPPVPLPYMQVPQMT
jgi:hypothetical protein